MRRSERGIALLLCILSLMVLTGIAIGMMYMTDSETMINANYRSSQQAYFASVAGLEEMRDRLRANHPSPIALPNSMPSLGGGVVYLLNPVAGETIQPWNTANVYFDNEICQENFPNLGLTSPGAGTPCSTAPSGSNWYSTTNSTAPYTNTSAAVSYKWVRLTLKANGSVAPYYVNGSNAGATLGNEICWDGQHETVLPAGTPNCPAMGAAYEPVYLITSLAVTPSGARRMVQSEYVQLHLPPLPSALTFDGPAPTFGAPNSNPYHIQGTDLRSCGGSPMPALPAVGAWDANSVTTVSSSIPNNRRGNYTGAGGTTPDVENLNSPPNNLDPTWKDPVQIQNTINLITSMANQVFTGPISNVSLGSNASPLITVVNGNLTMSGNNSGAGILLVTGSVTFSGNSSYNGIILVLGQGVFNANGGGNGQFNGGILVAKIYDASGNLLPSNGSPTVNWNGGGGNGIYYDSCWTNNVQNNFYYQRLVFREVSAY